MRIITSIMKHTQILPFFLVSFVIASTSWASPPPNASLDTFDSTYRGELFISSSNLSNQSGDTDPLPFNGEYRNFSNFFDVGYTFPQMFRISMGGVYAYADSTSDQFFSDESKSETKFNTVSATAQYYWNVGRFLIVPAVRIDYALEKIELYQSDIITSEGANRYQFGSWFKYPIWKLDNWAYLGYRMQSEEKADHFLWNLGTRYLWGSFYIQGELLGYVVAANDAFTSNPSVRQFTNQQGSASSKRYNSVNPDYMDAELLLGYRWENGFEVSGGLGNTITGKNTGYGTNIIMQVSYDFRTGGKHLDSANRISETGQFKPDYEEYDESIFSDD